MNRPLSSFDALREGLFVAVVALATLIVAVVPSPAPAQTPPAEQVAYYFGEVRTLSPARQPLATSLSLVKRALQPAENRIVEVVATIEAAKPVREFTTVFAVNGERFTIKDDAGTFAGEGELTGKPWEWTGWKYEAEMIGARKGMLKGDDRLAGDGITATKSFSTPDGVVRVLFSEELKPISKTAYDILHAKLLP